MNDRPWGPGNPVWEDLQEESQMLEDVVRDIKNKHVREIERILKEMPAGKILCVHDAVYNISGDELAFSATSDAHIISEHYDCEEKCRKTQYGPKPEDV